MNNKIEVLKTLTAYPLVLDKVYLQRELLKVSSDLNDNIKKQLVIKDNQIENLNTQLKALDKEKTLLKTQLRKQKLKSLKIGGIGVFLIITSLLIR